MMEKRGHHRLYYPQDTGAAFNSAQDGTHESSSGQAEIGRELLKFFKSDTTTKD
ncbi:MAG TPA: hypothetical protein VMS17_09265 [Gemmataceae bacterium]|nr:hypothetical protein [Gemmataceae bacterium]